MSTSAFLQPTKWLAVTLLCIGLVGCNADSPSDGIGLTDPADSTTPYAPTPMNLKILLTDAPKPSVDSVFVNIDHFEILLQKGGKKARLILAQDFGMIDLLTLRDGVTTPLGNVAIPYGVKANQIRLVLKEEGHYAVKNDGSICELQTPSAQKTGIKILLKQALEFKEGDSFSMVVDFDAEKSVVVKGNGGCLLKPVLKIKSLTRVPSDDVDENGDSENPGEEVGDGESNEDPSDDPADDPADDPSPGDGFDPTDPSTWPDGITEEDLQMYF